MARGAPHSLPSAHPAINAVLWAQSKRSMVLTSGVEWICLKGVGREGEEIRA